MSRTLLKSHRSFGRCRPRVERLETRLALSTTVVGDLLSPLTPGPAPATDAATPAPTSPNLSVLSTDPAQGATLTKSTATISVTFDRPIDPFSILPGDIVVETQAAGGWTPVFDSQNPPPESLDETGTVLSLALPQALSPGNYRLALSGTTSMAGLDGSPAFNNGADAVLAGFTVAKPGVTLADAKDLGAVSSTATAVAGSLDLKADPGAVGLYKFNVPAGHHWRLGAEVVARGAGNPLQSTLAVFDAQGKPVAIAASGRANASGDTYLYAGLDAGTYYLGVSGRGNVPGKVGGYDPAVGTLGALPTAEDGGTYLLNIVADPADTPTQVLGFSLDHADPIDPRPTGLTLAFSGLLNSDTLRGTPSPGLTLVNQRGQSFGLTAILSDMQAHYTFLFEKPLPSGHYTLSALDKAKDGVTDLAGLAPVAPGMPAGVLSRFDVKAKAARNADPHNLGPFYDEIDAGLNFGDTIAPGTAVSYRFVVTAQGYYHLTSQYQGGSMSAQLLGPGGLATPATGAPGQFFVSGMALNTGVYYLQWTNNGTTPLHLDWGVQKDSAWDSVLDNGVGQGPALNLRLVNPTSSDLATEETSPLPGPEATLMQAGPSGSVSPAGPLGTPATSSPVPTAPAFGGPVGPTSLTPLASTVAAATPAASARESGAVGGSNGGVNPPGLVFTLGGTLVGRPTTEAEHGSVVGPGGQSGSVALASAGSGMPEGIGYGPTKWRTTAPNPAGGEVNPDGEPDGAEPVSTEPVNGAMVEQNGPARPRQDEQAIASADWLTRLAGAASRWMSLAPGEAPDPVAAAPIAMTRDDSPLAKEADHVEEANLGAPLAIGLASLLAVRSHVPLRRWFRPNRDVTSPRRTFPLAGPHGPRRQR